MEAWLMDGSHLKASGSVLSGVSEEDPTAEDPRPARILPLQLVGLGLVSG